MNIIFLKVLNVYIQTCIFYYSLQALKPLYLVYPPDEMTVNLDDTGVVSGHIPGVSVISGVTNRFSGKPCSRQAVFKVFHKYKNK
jgi:hypothetical protein